MKNLNKVLEKISRLMHSRTGYSLRSCVLEVVRDFDMRVKYRNDFFILNSDEWQIFIELIEQACK